MTQSNAASGSGRALPLEVRALVLLVLLDILTGVWLGLHTKGVLSVFLAPQIPALGVGALLWGFLPEEPKTGFGRWLAWRLGQPAVLWSVLAVGGAGLLVTGFLSTIVVESVEASVSTPVHVLRGTWRAPDTASAVVLRLNRITSPQYHQLVIRPTGSPVWLHTETHLTVQDHAVRPWLPLRLQYPDDFEPMVVVGVLPDDTVLPKLRHRDRRLRVTADDSAVIADAVLADSAFVLAFTKPAVPGDEVRARWRAWLMSVSRDTAEFVNPMLEVWTSMQWIRASRPLRLGERLRWEVRVAPDRVVAGGQLVLNDAVSDLHLVF